MSDIRITHTHTHTHTHTYINAKIPSANALRSTFARCIALRRRIFKFLKGMREIKGVAKREKDIEKNWDWENGGVEISNKSHPGGAS